MYIYYNPNPLERKDTGDCAIRTVAKALDTDWETAYTKLSTNGFAMGDLPNSNQVISAVLRENGYYRASIPNSCPDCYTISDFIKDNPRGKFILGTGNHIVTVDEGNLYDTWDSSDLTPIYVYYKDFQPKFKED